MALGNTPRRETNISVEASKSYVLGLHFIMDDDGTPLDLTDSVLRLVAAEPPHRGSTEILSLIAEMKEPRAGLAQFKFQAADLTLEPGSYAYDVTMLPPSGYSTPILKGYIEVGANTDLDDTNVYTNLNVTSDITVRWDEGDVIQLNLERVDGMFLVVSALIENFANQMEVEVDKAAASAQDALQSENLAESYKNEMQVWLDNAGYPFWKGTQAEYNALSPKYEVLYLITDQVV